MRKLEADGVIDRELEGLPSREEIRHRIERGEGLSVPELAVLMAWTKIVLAEELLASDLPDDPFLHTDLFVYFPTKMQHAYRKEMIEHPLKREIIVTQVVNDLVNGAGMTFWPRLAGETGASAAELTNANFVAREIFGSLALREDLKAYDNKLDAGLQTRLRIEMRTLVERASRWLVNNRRPPLDSEAVAEFFTIPVQRLMTQLPELMGPAELEAYTRKRDELIELGAPEELASRVAVLHPAYALLGVTETAKREDLDPVTVAKVHFGIGERLGLSALIQRILELPRNDRWETMARAAMRDDLHGVQTHLTQQVLQATNPEATPADRIAAWEQDQGPLVARCSETIAEICDDERIDLARVSVGLRVVRGLLS